MVESNFDTITHGPVPANVSNLIDEGYENLGDNQCWLWKEGVRFDGRPVAMVTRYNKPHFYDVMNAVYATAHGREVREGRYAVTTCGCSICVNPQHMKLLGKKDAYPKPAQHKLPEYIEEKFVDMTENAKGGHLVWTGRPTKDGKPGIICTPDKKQLQAHRVAWEITTGVEPSGYVDMVCGNKQCVEPCHAIHKPNIRDIKDQLDGVKPAAAGTHTKKSSSVKQLPSAERCTAEVESGGRCKIRRQPDSELCHFHIAQQKRQNGTAGAPVATRKPAKPEAQPEATSKTTGMLEAAITLLEGAMNVADHNDPNVRNALINMHRHPTIQAIVQPTMKEVVNERVRTLVYNMLEGAGLSTIIPTGGAVTSGTARPASTDTKEEAASRRRDTKADPKYQYRKCRSKRKCQTCGRKIQKGARYLVTGSQSGLCISCANSIAASVDAGVGIA
jgi:hypothetical protein